MKNIKEFYLYILIISLFLFTACSNNVESSSDIGSFDKSKTMMVSSNMINTIISDNYPKGFYLNKAMLSLSDINDDGIPELFITTYMAKFNTCYEVFDTTSQEKLFEFYMILGDIGNENEGFEQPLYGHYYIDGKTEECYFIADYADGGIDGMYEVFQKINKVNGEYCIETITNPAEQSADGGYNFNMSGFNPFSDSDISKELYLVSAIVDYTDEKKTNIYVEQLVDDYYSGIEDNNKEFDQ